MSNYEYHQFLKFLYFEGYADSYEEAEYLLEELSDEELENLIEQSGITDANRRTRDRLIRQYGPEFFTNPRPTGKKRKVTSVKSIELTNQEPKKRRTTDMSKVIVAHYLFGEGYAETLEGAEVMAENISEDWVNEILDEAAKDQSDKQIDQGVKKTYKAGNVLDNTHQGRSPGLNKLSATERDAKVKRMRERLKARRDDLFQERGNREDAKREQLKKLLGL
jgi:hypothetical protein